MWVFAGVAIAALIALPWSWYRRSLSWLRSRVIARLTPRRLRRHGGQAQLPVAARWRFTTDGAAAPQVRPEVERNFDHPSYRRSADSAPPCVRVIALVPCGPLGYVPDSQELRDGFLAWLAQTPAMALIRDLRPGQQDVTWKSWATPRRSNLRADLTGEDQAQVPVDSAVLELPSDGVRPAGTDPRHAELILHVDLAPAENLTHAGGSRCGCGRCGRCCARWRPVGCPCDRGRCGMVIDRALATGLPRYDEHVRASAAAADEQLG